MVLGVVGLMMEVLIAVEVIVQQHQRLIMVLHSLKRVVVLRKRKEQEQFIMIGK